MMSDSMQELKQMRIWFPWRWGTDNNGKPTKNPFAANGGATGTDDAHSSTWVTYDEATAAVKKNHAAGVGFKIPENYFFLDIDHRELSDPLVKTLLARFDSYSERSVSGGGIHIYGKCDFSKLPTYIDNKDKVRLDKVIKEAFRLCMQGYGPTQIAKEFSERKFMNPTAHAKANGISIPDNRGHDDDYIWRGSTIVHMLSRQEYLGHTVNFKTYRKSYKNKKQLKNDPSEWHIFENTHEAIIEEPVFEVVQKIRDGRRRITPMGMSTLFRTES